MPPAPRAHHTVQALLDEAQELVQRRGFNAFSFQDLARAVGIRAPSIHHHFPAKADLGLALITRYRAGLDEQLALIEARHEAPRRRLEAFIEIYRSTAKQGLICLCGSLASDLESLRDDVRAAVTDYLTRSEDWVRAQLAAGQAEGVFHEDFDPREQAAALVAALQGALILARARPVVLDRVRRQALRSLDA